MKSPRHTVEASIEESWPLSDWRSVNVVVAVSGGADSMALLRAIWTLKDQCGGPGIVTAVHVNHQLRGPQSDEDEGWLAEQCQQLGVRFVARRVAV
ncbi:MAG: ATP-binding protein, partial [Lacipirellulaceae bacterium]